MSGYIGRFAPSPTGPLHFGSLVAALASYLDARAQQGKWLLRIEDIDPPREQPGATGAILRSLEAHHLQWDGDVLYQHSRHDAYREALQHLEQHGLSYRCTCSRQERQHDAVYNGHCRTLDHPPGTLSAIRLDIQRACTACHTGPLLQFDDLILGQQQQGLLLEAGDFVIHRKDGLFAYQLAVVVDDIHQQITHVIRGADLLDVTARQILLFRLLGAAAPAYGHVPLALNAQGQKLSKQNLAPALDDSLPSHNLFRALQFLKQDPPAGLEQESPPQLLAWAITHWDISALRAI